MRQPSGARSQTAARDATLVARLESAGAILLGALNMDEYESATRRQVARCLIRRPA